MMLPFLGPLLRAIPFSFSEFFQVVLATFLSKEGVGCLDFHAL
jgi:hypothetical protein